MADDYEKPQVYGAQYNFALIKEKRLLKTEATLRSDYIQWIRLMLDIYAGTASFQKDKNLFEELRLLLKRAKALKNPQFSANSGAVMGLEQFLDNKLFELERRMQISMKEFDLQSKESDDEELSDNSEASILKKSGFG